MMIVIRKEIKHVHTKSKTDSQMTSNLRLMRVAVHRPLWEGLNISVCVCPVVSVTASQICPCGTETAIDNTEE